MLLPGVMPLKFPLGAPIVSMPLEVLEPLKIISEDEDEVPADDAVSVEADEDMLL